MRLNLPRFVAPAAILAGVALVAVPAAGAQASTVRHSAPAAPTGVTATGTPSTVTLAWKGSRPSEAVVGYTVALSPSAGQRARGIQFTKASARSASYAHLTTGTTYSLSIVADGRYGHSKPVTVKYTPEAAQTVYALDSSSNLVKVPATGGTPVTVASDVSAYAVDPAGDAAAITSTGVVAVYASGATTTVVAGATTATDIKLDAAGNVYLLEGTDVVRIAAAAGHSATTVASESVAPRGFSVSKSGAVSLFEVADTTASVDVFPAGGGAVQSTSLSLPSGYTPLSGTFDTKGDLYYFAGASGASGSQEYNEVPVGQTTSTVLGSGFVRGGLGLSDDFYLLQSATFCVSYLLNMGACVPDLTVAKISVTSDSGVTTSVPVTGLSLAAADEHAFSATTSITSDSEGAIYVASSTGITSYARAGGAPTTLAAGSFTDVQLTR